MGRYVRSVLGRLTRRDDIALTLLVRDTRDAAAYHAIAGDRVDIAPLASALTKRRYDGVWYPWNGMRFCACVPALVTINDDFAFAYPARGIVARMREQRPIRRAIRNAARLTTISAWSRHALIARFRLRPERISIIPLAPDPYFTPGLPVPQFDEPFILVVGTGEIRKNVVFLIDAFERAFPERDVRLVIVGEPEVALATRIRRAIVPLTSLARVDDDQLRRLYRNAAAVAVPSLAEGFGLVVAEAQACGAAVIAANATALPEAVGEAGLTVDPRDADAWRDALRELVRNAALNARYRELAVARWSSVSLDATTDALLTALERAIDDGI